MGKWIYLIALKKLDAEMRKEKGGVQGPNELCWGLLTCFPLTQAPLGLQLSSPLCWALCLPGLHLTRGLRVPSCASKRGVHPCVVDHMRTRKEANRPNTGLSCRLPYWAIIFCCFPKALGQGWPARRTTPFSPFALITSCPWLVSAAALLFTQMAGPGA